MKEENSTHKQFSPEHKQPEEALKKAQNELEQRVKEHTRESQKSEEYFRVIANSTPVPLAITRLSDGKFFYVNTSLCILLGYPAEELIGRNSPDFYYDPHGRQRLLAALSQTGSLCEYETRVKRADGSPVWISLNMEPLTLEGEDVLFTALIDITKRKQVEKELRRSEEILRSVTQGSANHIMMVDLEGKIQFINRTVPDLTIDGVIGTSIYRYVPEKYRKNMRNSFDRVRNTAQVDHYEVEYHSSARQTTYHEARIGPIMKNGEVVAYTVSSHDATERKRAESALRESEFRFRTIFEQSNEGMGLTDIKGNYLLVNPAFCKMTGYSETELLRMEVRELVPPDVDIKLFPRVASGQTGTREAELLRKDGSRFMAEITGFPIDFGKGKRLLGIVRDITEQKQIMEAKEKLRQKGIRSTAIVEAQENERRRISRELHDGLGQVLTAIRLNFEMFKDSFPTVSTKQAKVMVEIEAQLKRAVAEGERISHNLMPRVLDDFGIAPALELLCNQITQQGGLKVTFYAHRLTKRLESNIELGLYRIAQEAINNVVKHAGAKETNVQIVRHPSAINLTIEDDGKGFNVEEIQDVPISGGMGLINIRERAESLKGTLTVESNPGAGTAIIVELPTTEESDNGSD